MPNRRRSAGPRAAPKLFKCTGYGNCDMVFTRSEHLARHERKHTGEKPYKCVVPGCGRMFSRFDNMMQHTQTHEKNKKMVTSRSTPTTTTAYQDSSTAVKSEHRFTETRHHPMPDLITKPLEHSSMIDSRTLPLPTRRASMSSASYHPTNDLRYPAPFNHHPLYASDAPRNRSSWPIKREPYPHSFYHQQSYQPYQPYPTHDDYNRLRRRSSTSTVSSESTLASPISTVFPHQQPQVARRRISIDDLRLPIEDLRNIQLDEKPFNYTSSNSNSNSPRIDNSVDISPDEFEALEGFSKFHTSSIIGPNASSPAELTPSPVLRNESPNFASQVCAMRHRVMSMNESFQRG